MIEKSSINNIEPVPVGRKLSRLGLASLIIAVAVIPLFYVSVHRIDSLNENSAYVCIVEDTPFYNTIHTLCVILPVVSVGFAILSLTRFLRKRIRFASAIPALAGLLLTIASFTIYYLALLALAGGHSH
ncbi:MAG: hypothetical protein ABII09_00830 [Planctomycetota bacterium]